MLSADSSLEIIETRSRKGNENRKPIIDVIELTSGIDETSAVEGPANTKEYPSSPKIQRSSPVKVGLRRESLLDDSAELSYAFLNDTMLQSDSIRGDEKSNAEEVVPLPNSSVNLSRTSSPIRPQRRGKSKNALEQIVSDDAFSFSDITDGHISSPQFNRTGMTVGALGAKWSQLEPTNTKQYTTKDDTQQTVTESKQGEKITPQQKLLFVQSSPRPFDDSCGLMAKFDENFSQIPKTGLEDDEVIEESSIVSTQKSPIGSPRKSGLFISKKRRPISSHEKLLGKTVLGDKDALQKNYGNFIVHSRHFTDKESQHEVSKAVATAAGKKGFNAVNKLFKDAAILKSEMILDMDESLCQDFTEEGIDFKKELQPAQVIHLHETKPLIKLRRRCKSIYDLNRGLFYPSAEKMVKENVAVLFYDALEFFHQFGIQQARLLEFIQDIKTTNQAVIITLSGKDELIKGIQSLENRRFRKQVEEELHGPKKNRSRSRSKKLQMLEEMELSIEQIDQQIDDIAVNFGVHFFTVESQRDFVTWLNSLIVVVGKKRYDPAVRHQEWSHITMRSAQDPQDSLGKTLEQLDQMTSLKVQRVISVYKNFQHLYEDIEKGFLTSGDDGNPLMASAAEKAMVTLLTSENPEDLLYMP
ncbi:LAME_0F03290g1_1 [Lachancea meyersii CBS 8951]|uniref:LAME_0F03290g1_1 n=1 Tax=Lachancea meyersii CBS 8951 TaxID=1266667 RepID=A0A1G4JR39_9SACH|nr:LAME_0F03290g1_1 [Lachancea meyersii CBS 8951]